MHKVHSQCVASWRDGQQINKYINNIVSRASFYGRSFCAGRPLKPISTKAEALCNNFLSFHVGFEGIDLI